MNLKQYKHARCYVACNVLPHSEICAVLACVCVCSCACYIPSMKIWMLLEKWGHLGSEDIFVCFVTSSKDSFRVKTWELEMHYVIYDSPLKDSNTRMCVCVVGLSYQQQCFKLVDVDLLTGQKTRQHQFLHLQPFFHVALQNNTHQTDDCHKCNNAHRLSVCSTEHSECFSASVLQQEFNSCFLKCVERITPSVAGILAHTQVNTHACTRSEIVWNTPAITTLYITSIFICQWCHWNG